MRHTTYSFEDLAGVIYHPLLPPYQFTGEGVGNVEVRMTTERTAHNVAADGSIMISKIAGNNGQVTVTCQQTSLLHKWLLKLYNTIMAGDSAQWALTTVALRNVVDGTNQLATGVSFGKRADKSYQAEGQIVTWTLWAASIVEENYIG
jgi:hypothetical protein